MMPPMKVVVGGSSGLVGTALLERLRGEGHAVERLVRDGRDGIVWDPATYALTSPDQLSAFDAVVHLGGEGIAGRWTTEKKRRIRDSRVQSTQALAQTVARLKDKPSVLVVASAIGYYGDRNNEELTEKSAPGSGFLAKVCQQWEQAADPAREAGIRVVHLRFGMALSARGGALKTMLPPFKAGLGGKVGSGQQWMSWISLDDAVGVVLHALTDNTIEGPINAVAPTPCTNLEFTKTLGSVLHRPTALPVPAFLVRLALGEMADALLLASQRVRPGKLSASGYLFQHTAVKEALSTAITP